MAKKIIDIIPDAETLISLEPDDLAGVVLEYLNSAGENSSDLNRYNFGLPHIVKDFPAENRKAISEALMEGWIWLEREGLIAPRPGLNTDGNWVFITRRGRQIKNRCDLESYNNSNLLPRRLLHPVIAQKVWSAFIRGEYDTAVFQAFKEVEISVRERGNFQQTDIGVPLMRRAFDSKNGPLIDRNLPDAENEALSHLFAGAIGSYKNPQSHRNVSISDPTEAVEMIILASHLLKIIDTRGLLGETNK